VTFISKLADEIGGHLGWTLDVTIRASIERIDKELEAVSDEEMRELLMEYRAYLREIGGLISQLLYKLSVDKTIDPQVAEKLSGILRQVIRR